MLASALNRGERSRLNEASDGHVFGWDVVGVVERAGTDSTLTPGERVLALSLPGGGWAELVSVRQADVSRVPVAVSTAEAATIPVAGLTALRAVRTCPNLLGATVLVIGGGAVASYAIQLAVLAGARVIALVRSAEAAQRVRDLGAHEVLSGASPVRASCDLVVDTVGGSATQVAVGACRPFGRVVIVGNLGDASAGLAPSDLVSAGCLVQGYRLVVDATAAPVGADLGNLINWVSEGRIRTAPVQEMNWRDSARIAEALAGRMGNDRAVLRMAED
ncbi:zinc-binding dehydrogenase [Jatrophihabitans telluris]|uniref:Zinc-binding dehydrogenase n=1 Tax=Jatrophihabitans telluris TaxID=2038343 RepID=A0ABY4R1G9_9ACTN|nr:zinc-binding dehydrogenase [Jatrophihabitans telluris]UQX88981.1 zinc-binding dehydrogenase [Jatrophihabitans telluris]